MSEKSLRLAQNSQFSFLVQPQAGKTSIKEAVESLFGVEVIGVEIVKLKGKRRRLGKKRLLGRASIRKKAIVTLKPGQKIDYFQLPEKKTKKK